MTSIVTHDPLTFRNQSFAIHHAIDDCPPTTVVRELVKNAVDNAVLLETPGRIEWFDEIVDGVPKLGLYNEGPGMSGEELSELMDLASTGKTLGTEANYGQGGKLSSLKVSPYGVIYRSCTRGRISQITLCAEHRPNYDFPIYVKKKQQVMDDQGEGWFSVVDVTHLHQNRRGLDRDWTEVLLLGTKATHNTLRELVPSETAHNWIARLLNRRFFRFPKGIAIGKVNISGPQGQKAGSAGARVGRGLEKHTLDHSEKTEDVPGNHPRFGSCVIRYCKLRGAWGENDKKGYSRGQTMEAYGIGTRGDHVCLVWRDECYDFHSGWSRISGPFGFVFGSANVAVQILLPDNAPVKNNTYRDAIIDVDENHQRLTVQHFAELVRANRPQWMIDYVEAQGRKSDDGSNLMDRLKAFLDQLRAQPDPRSKVSQNSGEDQGERNDGLNGDGSESDSSNNAEKRKAMPHHPAMGKRLPSQRSGIPRIMFTHDPAHLEQMEGRAAMHVRDDDGSIVLLNPRHFWYLDFLETIYAKTGPDEQSQKLAKRLADDEYKFHAGKFVIQAWLYKGRANWTEKDFEEALSMGSLTVYMTAPSIVGDVLQKLNQRLQTRKMESLEHGS